MAPNTQKKQTNNPKPKGINNPILIAKYSNISKVSWIILTPSDALMRRHQTRDNTMKASELKRINKLLTSAAVNRIMGDDCTKDGDHSQALYWLRKEASDWAALYEEFGITNGAHEVHIKLNENTKAA
jgi:hypothetical protein